MTDAPKAIFLSYAREDTDAARRIAEALRGFGVEVWFDQSELRGGDQWDAKIRTQIKSCALFIPLISATTQERDEGYFRLEWKLADDRSHLMAAGKAFIVPVVIDDTPETGMAVPDSFTRAQWTRLAGGTPTPQFVEQVKRLLAKPQVGVGRGLPTPPDSVESRRMPRSAAGSGDPALQGTRRERLSLALGAVAALAVAAGLYFALRPSAKSELVTAPVPQAAPAAATPAKAPENQSIAVLAFADMSEGRNNEFFSDGVSEELLNVLAKVPGLRVAARTSAFSFKGKNLPIPEIAAKLNVAYIVEGSVQRAGDRVKITAQLIKAADGFHVWSDTFTRDAKDVFAVQEEIAGRIAKELSLKLGVSSVAAKAAVNPEAFELFVQARMEWNQRSPEAMARAEQRLNRVLELDPGFAPARALLALVWCFQAVERRELGFFGQRDAPLVARIRAEVDRALALDPNLAEAHTALGYLHWLTWRNDEAVRSLRLATTLNPNYATAYQFLGRRLLSDGRLGEAEAVMRRATELDPLSHRILDNYFIPLSHQGRYAEALTVVDRALALQPDSLQARVWRAICLSHLGRHGEAVAVVREVSAGERTSHQAFAVTVLVRAGLADEAEQILARIPRDDPTDRRVTVLARLGRPQEALDAMDAAKINAPTASEMLYSADYDPIRADPRFIRLMATLGLTEAHARAQAERAARRTEKPR